ncbi:Acidic repeat-containing protein [Holothuria leucospilota]|uniref:Acidic repeat-containing protein n=1 Tax=Holothuria leucospilota TaxID=206669 RepID=A0A9Q1BJL4_HOLLE|nr:Acidic repeat-containing protein [Holothuria leucospilota]
MNKLNSNFNSDNSSSDEDVDCLLQRASNKLGWSSHKNYEDTFQTLLRTVENSKKKKKSYSTKSKRQTPRPRNTKPSSPILSSSEVPTPKRILSFANDGDITKEKPEAVGNGNRESESLKKSFQSNVTLCDHVTSHQDDVKKTVTQYNICKNHDSTENCTEFKPVFLHKNNEENSTQGHFSNASHNKTNVERECSLENLSGIDCSVGDGSGTSETSGNHHDNQHNACAVTRDDHPWLSHRGDKVTECISSDSEEDKSLPAISLQEEENTEEENVLEDSFPPSLSQRLVDNFRKKKKEDGGLHRDQSCKEKPRLSKVRKPSGVTKNPDDIFQKIVMNTCPDLSSPMMLYQRGRKPFHHDRSSSSDDDDDDFETFLMKMKTPKKTQPSCDQYLSLSDDDDFINDDPISEGEEDEEDDYLLHIKLDNGITPAGDITNSRAILSDHTNKVKLSDDEVVVLSSPDESEDEDDVFVSSVKPKWKVKNKENFLLTPKTPINKPVLEKKISFLESLNTPPVGTPVRSEFVKDFKKRKEELAQRLFTMFNKTVFDGKLPVDMEIRWNKRMRKTAGYCVYTKGKFSSTRSVRLELSEKVCDSAERLRDTLVHEMCHAACWLINGVNDGHGRYWKYWASKANIAHPEIPVVKRCHSYEIHTKYKYQCQQCKAVVGRHSKSIDVNKKCCGLCKGRFILLPPENQKQNKCQQPNKFAIFVKENYAIIKKSNECFKHADVMRTLSQEFARKTTLGD